MTSEMPAYETLLLIDPALSDDDVGRLVGDLGKKVAQKQGKIIKEEKIGRRRLAHIIKKKADGNYVNLHLELPAGFVSEWESQLRIHPNVLRVMTVRAGD